jgi:hypothetical protein
MRQGIGEATLGKLRVADKKRLGQAPQDARLRTVRLLDHYEAALGASFNVPLEPTLNPPRWGVRSRRLVYRLVAESKSGTRALGLDADPYAFRFAARQARRGLDD